MRANEFITEVNIDNRNGAGAVPFNQEIDYFGLRTLMTPGTFLALAARLSTPTSKEGLVNHIKAGGAIGAPFLKIKYPPEWEDGDFSQPAQVTGHEGRNRVLAVQEVEGDVSVEVHIFFDGGVRRRDLTDEIITQLNTSLIPEKSSSLLQGPFFRLSK